MKALTYKRVCTKGMLLLLTSMMVITNHNFCNAQELTFTAKSMSAKKLVPVTSYGSSLVDFNQDGNDDITVANISGNDYSYTNNGDGFSAGGGEPNSLFRNNKGTSFTKITEGEIATDKQNSLCGNWADIDNDGDQDLLSLNMGEENYLYINNGDGTFIKSTDPTITDNKLFSISCSWVDYNNDGYLYVYIGNGGFRIDSNYLFMNNGDATFTQITEGDIVISKLDTWNSLWGDLDNDGDQDMIEIPISTNSILHINNGNSNNW